MIEPILFSCCGLIGENFQSMVESMALKGFASAHVFVGAVGIEPVTRGINMKVDYLCQIRAFDQKLLFGNEASDQLSLGLIQMESLAIGRAIHSSVSEKYLGRTRLNDHRQQLGSIEIVA